MSKENVELVLSAVDAWNREGIEAVVPLAADDAVIHAFPEWPDDPIFRGKDGWRDLLNRWDEMLGDLVWESNRVIDTGDGVVQHLTLHGKPMGSDMPIAQTLGLWTRDFRGDGTVGEAHFFLTWEEVSQAAGLSE
jgi:ketosteroid isomerase-like protein